MEFLNKDLDQQLTKYATIAGYNTRLTRSQTQARIALQEDEPETFISGNLYKNYNVVEYEPDNLMIRNNFIPAQQVLFKETMLNDCLTFNVNQLVRHKFFTKRQQVQKLWKETLCKGDEYVNNKKKESGVSISAFRNFFVKDGKVFSIFQLEQFKGKDSYAQLRHFI